MNTEDIFKRRRNHNTPKPVMLIITNYVVCCALFTMVTKAGWFFITVLLLLAVYNFFNIRRNHEEYNKANIIAYAISLVGLLMIYFIARRG
jgi:uncharacterized membrane protein SirB2